MMKVKIDAVGLFVNDMETMVSFYRDVMGMDTDWNGSPNAEFFTDGTRLIMYGRNNFENMTSRQFSYPSGLNGTFELAFDFPSFEDVDKEFKRLVEAGATPVLEPSNEPWGQHTAYIADPEGNLIEISSFSEFAD
jgi:catechol 2,3-dioxygenase-like lactoylglutathione lyase family enzyme